MSVRIFVPADTAAVAMGADEIALAIELGARESGIPVEIVRNGSRGHIAIEPLVEVETAVGRVGYGPVTLADVPGLIAAGLFTAGPHAKRIGRPEETAFLRRQTRFTFSRCGLTDPLSLDDYRNHGGFAGFERALRLTPSEIIDEIDRSGLRGCGGAGFPAGLKWRTVLDADGPRKYIVCNADEGDSGTFADRMLLEGDPFTLIEGMLIAALAVGASEGFIYVRSEYPHAVQAIRRAIEIARSSGLLGETAGGRTRPFDIEVRVGAGAYVCGEETALLESLEGRRGQVRAKPPLPAHSGLWGRPTLVNNVLTFAAAPFILAEGGGAYASVGYGRSRGTMPFQLAGDIKFGGLFETPFGLSLEELIDSIGSGAATGRPIRAVQVGGPLGAYFPRSLFGTPLDYEAFAALEGLIGHGGVVVFNDTVDLLQQARFAMEFCAVESCGKCTPCRIGSTRGIELLDRIAAGARNAENIDLLSDLCDTMKVGSLCALGGLTPYPVLSALTHFAEDFSATRESGSTS